MMLELEVRVMTQDMEGECCSGIMIGTKPMDIASSDVDYILASWHDPFIAPSVI